MGETLLDVEEPLADLRHVSVDELPNFSGDSVLEATIRRLKERAEDSTQTVVSAFASSI